MPCHPNSLDGKGGFALRSRPHVRCCDIGTQTRSSHVHHLLCRGRTPGGAVKAETIAAPAKKARKAVQCIMFASSSGSEARVASRCFDQSRYSGPNEKGGNYIIFSGDLGSLRSGGSLVLFTIAFCQAHTHGQRLPGHLCTPCSAGLAARQRHPGPHHVACPPPLHAQALAWGPLAALRLHQASNPRRRPLAATQPPTRAHARSLPQAPRTTAMANSSYRNSTAFIWHSSGGRCPPQRPPALKTSSSSETHASRGGVCGR